MARNDQVVRILKVIGFLEGTPQGLSVAELHRKLSDSTIKCSPRSVYRDLSAIQQAHLPVVREGSGEDAKWRLQGIATVSPNIQISYREMMALFIARRTISSMNGSPVFDA